MTAGSDKPKRSRVEYLDRDQIKALREKESEARKARASLEHQNGDRIMLALDKLGQRLVQSESERNSLKDLIDQAKDHQKEMQVQLETSLQKQQNVEDNLRQIKQQNSRLNRKLENQDQARARLNRRMQRIEHMAQDAQDALKSKAMVLLTDQHIAQKTALPTTQASGHLPPAIHYQAQAEAELAAMPAWQRPLRFSAASAVLMAAACVGLGLLVAGNLNKSQTAFAVLQDGTLAQIDLRSGDIKPIQIKTETVTTPEGRQFATTKTDRKDAGDLKYDADGIPAQADRGRIAALQTLNLPDLNDSISKDTRLKGNAALLEDQAFTGNAEAQHDLAALYTAGQDAPLDYERSVQWFTQAANAGVANAAYNLGVLTQQGLGTENNIALALDWYRRAALLGHAEAAYNMGIAYIEGIGTDFNPAIAASLFQNAAMQGIIEAAYNLGLILENELISGSQEADALVWYRAAMEGGSADARSALSALAEKLNQDFNTAGVIKGGQRFKDLVALAQDEQKVTWPKDVLLKEIIPSAEETTMIELQTQMAKLGLYNGPQDGKANEALRQAIGDYQKTSRIQGEDMTFVEFLSLLLTIRTAA